MVWRMIKLTPYKTIRLLLYKYEAGLKLGMAEICSSADSVKIIRMHAPGNKPGSGFGIAKFREIVALSMTLACPGKIITDVSTSYGSPHLFYLYMGMRPIAKERYYVRYMYGTHGEYILEALENGELLSRSDIRLLTDMLNHEKNLQISTISLEEIEFHKPFLLSLSDKRIDYLHGEYLPNLFEILQKSDPRNKFPDTTDLGSGYMELTEAGFASWKFAIENNLEFVPSRH